MKVKKQSPKSSFLKTISTLTLFFFCVTLPGSPAVYAETLVPGADLQSQMVGGMSPDDVMGSNGDWTVEDIDVSGEETAVDEVMSVFSEVFFQVLSELIFCAIFGLPSFGNPLKTQTDEAADGSKTQTTYFEDSDRVKRQEFYDASGNLISGWEIYESGVYKWKKTASTGYLKNNGFETYYDDINSGVLSEGHYLGRVAEVIYPDGTGFMHEYISSDSFQIRQTRSFAKINEFERSLTGYTNYEYYGDSTRIRSELTYDKNGDLVSGLGYYESGNVEWKTSYSGSGLVYRFADAVDMDETGLLVPRILSETTAEGVEISKYEYDPVTGLLASYTSYDEMTGRLTGQTFYTYWNDGSVKSRERYDGDGLLTHRDTRYDNGRIESEYRQATNQTAYFSDESVSMENGKVYGRLTRVVYATGEDYFSYDGFGRLSQRWVYQNGMVVRIETSEYENDDSTTAASKTVRSFDKNGRAAMIDQYNADGELVSSRELNPQATAPVDYDVTYSHADAFDATGDGAVDGADLSVWEDHYLRLTDRGKTDGDFNLDGVVDDFDRDLWFARSAADPVSYRYVVEFYPGTDTLKKIERYENGVLISFNQYAATGAIEIFKTVAENTTYEFSLAVQADPSSVQLNKVSYKKGDTTIQVNMTSQDDGARVVVLDNWDRAIKSVYDTGSWIETEYRYDEFDNDADRRSKLKESLFDESGLLVRGLIYDDTGVRIRYLVDPSDNYFDCYTDDCLQYDAGIQDVEELNGITGASIAMIEVGYGDPTQHALNVREVVTSLVGADTQTQVFMAASDSSGATTHYDIANAIRKAADEGFKVISLSVQFPSNLSDSVLAELKSVLQSAVDYARSKNAIVVVAAGNGKDNDALSPLAELQGVVSVGATDVLGRDKMFSNQGEALAVTANGYQVLSPSDAKLTEFNGTSFSTPIVASAISMLMGFLFSTLGMDADVDMVIDAILSSAQDLGAAGHDDFFGWGKIDVAAAFSALQQMIL